VSFLEQIEQFEQISLEEKFQAVTADDVALTLARDRLDGRDLLHLLSEPATGFLEEMAQKARRVTHQYFGRTIGLYAPMYIADYCTNYCTYCGFSAAVDFKRTKLTLAEIEQEAQAISASGIRHILVLTGEAQARTQMSYLVGAVEILKKYFSSIALEIFPMDGDDYRVLVDAGADSLTVYQEVYDRQIYKEVHPRGKKSDYSYRLLTPERGARAGFRAINIGTLFGLGEPRSEAFLAGLHAKYLEHEFPEVEISLSLPRMTKARGGIKPRNILSDKGFVQCMLAWRLFMPRLGLTVSTRESAAFRDKLIHLGATRFSAGSKTDVGGYASQHTDATPQFEITDERSVDEVAAMISKSGYQPVFKDWEIV